MSLVQPRLTTLKEDQINLVHESALTILAKAGLKVMDAKARRVLAGAGCGRKGEDRFFLPREVVDWAIKAAPGQVELFSRDGRPAFNLAGGAPDQTIYGIGVTNLYYQDPLTDEVSPFGREQMAASTRLGQSLDEYQVISTPGVIQDVGTGRAELIGCLEMLANTRKPLVLLVSELEAFRVGLEMYDRLAGLNPDQPFVIPYFNPITPLTLNAETSLKMDLAIESGLPIIFSNYGMSGASCPLTPAGTLALLTAELLAGLVYSQLIREGAPIILGSLPASFDMKTMESYYTPAGMLVNQCCAEMMAHYQVPHCGASGGWMGWGADLMTASMMWLNHLTSQLGQVGLAPFVGSNFDSLVFSPATVVYSAEVIRMAGEFREGFSLDEAEMGLEEILDLGPGASYLTSRLTLKNFRDQPVLSRIWPTLSLEKWQKQGQPQAGAILREQTRKVLAEAQPPKDHDEILAAGEEFLAGRGR